MSIAERMKTFGTKALRYRTVHILGCTRKTMSARSPSITPSGVKQYLWTDIYGKEVFQDDTVKSYHNSWSKDSYLFGTLAGIEQNWSGCPCGEPHLRIVVIQEVSNGVPTTLANEDRYFVYPSCVEQTLGGAVIELV